MYVGDLLSIVGGYHDKCGEYLGYRGGVQPPWGDIMSTVGVILSTVGDTQYRRMHMVGHHEYCGGCSVLWWIPSFVY